jgi:hypothetical protein
MIEVIHSSETSVLTKNTQRKIPEDGFLHSLKSSLMKIKAERDPQQMAQCIYNIPCECGISHISKKARPLSMRLHEHRHNLEEGLYKNPN